MEKKQKTKKDAERKKKEYKGIKRKNNKLQLKINKKQRNQTLLLESDSKQQKPGNIFKKFDSLQDNF